MDARHPVLVLSVACTLSLSHLSPGPTCLRAMHQNTPTNLNAHSPPTQTIHLSRPVDSLLFHRDGTVSVKGEKMEGEEEPFDFVVMAADLGAAQVGVFLVV